MYDWSALFIDAAESIGQTFKIPRQSKRLIQEAGFIDVVETKYKMPVGGWMAERKWKDLGRWNLLFLTTGLEGMQLWLLRAVLGVSDVFQSFGRSLRRRICTCMRDKMLTTRIVGNVRDQRSGSTNASRAIEQEQSWLL